MSSEKDKKAEAKKAEAKKAEAKKADSKKEKLAIEKGNEARAKAREAAKKRNSHLHNLIAKGKKSVKVLGMVNMHCLDGCELKVGKECMITESEANRLEADKRGEMIKRLK